jgi:hypothetical protein
MACRLPDGTIDLETWEENNGKNAPWYKKTPLVRGCVSFVTSLTKGYKYMMKSAEKQMDEEELAEYHKQKDYYARGVWQKPKAFLVATGSGARAIEGYSCKASGDTLESFMYVPDNDIYIDNNEQEAIDICERCEDAIVYQTALLALSSYKDVQGRELLPQLILQYSGIEPAQQPKTQRR